MGMTRTPLIAGNWKMNLDHLQTVALDSEAALGLKDAKHEFDDVDVAVFPPFTDLRSVQTLIDADKIPFGSVRRISRSTTQARTPGRSRANSWPSSRSDRSSSATRSAASTTPRATSRAAEEPGGPEARARACASASARRSEDLEKYGASAVPVGQLETALEK